MMFFFKYLPLITIAIALIVNENIQDIQSLECLIQNKEYLNEYLYQDRIHSPNDIVNACMKPIGQITNSDRGIWIARLILNDKITFQNKKSGQYLCASSLVYTLFHRIHISVNNLKSTTPSCIWDLKKMKKKQSSNTTDDSFFIWNTMTKRQLYVSNKTLTQNNQHKIGFSQQKNKIKMNDNYKWIMKCKKSIFFLKNDRK